jgi:type IV pilus assembly protein PilV
MKDIKNIFRGKNKNGFSLIEVLVSLVILAIGLLAIGGMQVISIKESFFSNNVTKATIFAQTKMEGLKRLSYNDANLSSGEHNEGTISGSMFSRKYDVKDTTTTIKTITVAVQWTEKVDHNISLSTMRAK